MATNKIDRRKKIKMRIRKKISGTVQMPRLTVFRSNKHIFAQIVDDDNSKTMAAASSLSTEIKEEKGNKTLRASAVGKLIAQKAIQAGIDKVVFDRNGFLYHGRVKALANAAREAGLKF